MSAYTIFDAILAELSGILLLGAPLLKLLMALIVFFFFWAMKKKFTAMVGKLLYRILNHKKQWLEKEQLDQAMIPCRSVFALIGAYLALSILGWTANPLITHGLRIAVIGLVAWILVRFWDASAELLLDANELLGKQLNLNLSKTLMSFLRMAVKVIIIIFAALAILAETGTDVTALVTGLGLGGLTFALAAQDTASNLFAGVVILLDRPFAVEDYIETPDVEGTVEEITFRSTRIRTLTNAQIVVPNNVLTSKPITNWSRLEKRRVTATLKLEYGCSSQQISRCIERITALLEESPLVVEDSVCVYFEGFIDSSLVINILYYTRETAWAAHMKVRESLNLQIMAIVEEEGCSFAFPTQTLHIQQ